MKKITLLVIVGILLFQSSNGQVTTLLKDNFISFEAKQKKALQNAIPFSALPQNFNYRYAAKKATQGVVFIKYFYSSKNDLSDFLNSLFQNELWRHYFGDELPNQTQAGSISGVLVSDDGYIVTNNHVVDEADSIEVMLHDQRTYKAQIIGTDPSTDIALLKISEKHLPFIEFGNSDTVEVGDIILAAGNPLDLPFTVTTGIVSAKARDLNILTTRWAVESYIQTNAAVGYGSSGGALVNVNGKLIGITAAISTSPDFASFSFAIPVDLVKKIIDDLLHYGKAMPGYLGITASNLNGEMAKKLGYFSMPGVIVDKLQLNSAAVVAGLQQNDIITDVDHHHIQTTPQLLEIIARHSPGEKINLTIFRGGKIKTLVATLKSVGEMITTKGGDKELLKTLGIEIETISLNGKEHGRVVEGIKVTKIIDGEIARQTSMKKDFIIFRINNKEIHNKQEFIQAFLEKKGQFIVEGIYPGNERIYYYEFTVDAVRFI